MRLKSSSIVLSMFITLIVTSHCLSQERLVVVTGESVNIRTAPNTSSTIVTQAIKGDIFILHEKRGNWFEIGMFGGEYRYIHTSLAEETLSRPTLPSSEEVRRRACIELVRAQDRAVKEAMERYPTDYMKQADYERLLYDRYELPVFHRFNIAPALNAKLIVEGAQKGWLPP